MGLCYEITVQLTIVLNSDLQAPMKQLEEWIPEEGDGGDGGLDDGGVGGVGGGGGSGNSNGWFVSLKFYIECF